MQSPISSIKAMSMAATVSGSFRRHLPSVQQAVAELTAAGVRVLSPSDPRVVDAFGDFVFVSSDLRRSIKGVQNRHLDAIRHSDFLWLACPDGYVGPSAAMELGYAVNAGIPVFSDAAPSDWTLRQYVTPVVSIAGALAAMRGQAVGDGGASLLLEPAATITGIRRDVDSLEHLLLHDRTPRAGDPVDATTGRIRRSLNLPAR
jgi:hypothetical protein